MSAIESTSDQVCGVGRLFPQTELRPAATVMKLDRMGSAFPSRLSFMRALLRDLRANDATLERGRFELDDDGFGRAVYTVSIAEHSYSLVAFSTPLAPEDRTDRVIAEAWDSSFVLYDGIPDTDELERLAAAAPRQEAGRYRRTDLVLSRANRSVRLFDHVVDRLAEGLQPDRDTIGSIGYLMRTTAVYGNGKFGIADRNVIVERPVVRGAFRAEMLAVWLIRTFTHDLVEHIAQRRSPATAAKLTPDLKRHLGIGNATGLGMAPFLVSHPELLNNWVLARETALARVCAVRVAEPDTHRRFHELLSRAMLHVGQWRVDDQAQMKRILELRQDLAEVQSAVDGRFVSTAEPWARLMAIAPRWSTECGELLVSLLLETHPHLVDGLADCMTADESGRLDPAMTVSELRDLLDRHWQWATTINFQEPENCRRFWYTSEDKLEPRLGDRFEEAGAELERPLDVARRVSELATALSSIDGDEIVAAVVLAQPGLRLAVQRVQASDHLPYGEIQDNLIAANCRPIDMLRFKLSFFGASKFDPKSDLWTRVTLFQGAPLFDELGSTTDDDWWLPVLHD